VWLAQESLVFYPQALQPRANAPAGWRLEEIAITARDGTRLAGVLALPDAARPPLVIYFGGNAEEVTAYAPEAPQTYGPRAALFLAFLQAAARIARKLARDAKGGQVEVFDPVPALLERKAGFERAQLLVRSGARAALHAFLPRWREALNAREERRVRWALDVDPQEV